MTGKKPDIIHLWMPLTTGEPSNRRQAEALGKQLSESLAMLATATSEIGMRTSQLEKVTTAQTELLSRIGEQCGQVLKATDRLSRQVARLEARLDRLHQDLFVDG